MKPHIRMINGRWWCSGQRLEAWGRTAAQSYAHWRRERANNGGMSITLAEFWYLARRRSR